MMNTNFSSNRSNKTRKMAIVGILTAVLLLLSMIPMVGYIKIGIIDVTIMHLPVIIGAIIEGPIVGMILGLIFGLTSLIKAFTVPTITSLFFMNPIVSILPRMIVGIASYYVYILLSKIIKKTYISGLLSGLIGSLINTILVLGTAYVLYGDIFINNMGKGATTGLNVILSITATNGIPEAIVAGFLVAPVVSILKKIKK